MGVYADDLVLTKRDLSDVLSTIVKDSPRFIRYFPTRPAARHRKHEWQQDQIAGRSLTVVSISGSTITASAADVAKLKAGTLFTIKGDTALFKVASMASETTFTFALAAAHGSSTTTPAASDTLKIITTPMKELSANGDGEESYWKGGTDYNYLQIFRKEVLMSNDAQATDTYDGSNSFDKQLAFAVQQMSRDMSRAAIHGYRLEPGTSVPGVAGGLYEFLSQTGALSVNASAAAFDSFVVNDAIQAVVDEGGHPNAVICNPAQARVFANERKKEVQILRADDARGVYAARVVSEITGELLEITGDPDLEDTEALVADTSGFGLVPLQGNALRDEDTTERGLDGRRHMLIGHYTFEFKNWKQRLCRVYGLKGSAAAIAAIKAG